MASLSLPSHLPVLELAILYLSQLFLLSVLPISTSQDPTASSSPTIAQCTMSQLLPLASCVPFVQGATPMPPTACCDNLKQLSTNVPNCLCLFLNGNAFSSFPINTTRALQLPHLCTLQLNTSTCSSVDHIVPPSPPSSKVSPTVKTNSTITNATVWASPVAQPAPNSSFVGLGLDRTSASFKPRVGIQLTVVIAMTLLLLVLH